MFQLHRAYVEKNDGGNVTLVLRVWLVPTENDCFIPFPFCLTVCPRRRPDLYKYVNNKSSTVGVGAGAGSSCETVPGAGRAVRRALEPDGFKFPTQLPPSGDTASHTNPSADTDTGEGGWDGGGGDLSVT